MVFISVISKYKQLTGAPTFNKNTLKHTRRISHVVHVNYDELTAASERIPSNN